MNLEKGTGAVSRYKFDWRQSASWRSHGAEFLLRPAERIRVPGLSQILVSGSESSKKHDKQLTFSIVRVIASVLLIVKM